MAPVVDDERIEGQEYVLLSFVAPDARQKHAKGDLMSLKVRGAFGTLEEANRHAEQLRAADPLYDIYVAEMGKWLPFPPNPEKIPNQQYAEEYLNSLHTSYIQNQEQKKKVFGDRKKRVLRDGLDANLLPEERVPAAPAPVTEEERVQAAVRRSARLNRAAAPAPAPVTEEAAGPSTGPGSSAATSTS